MKFWYFNWETIHILIPSIIQISYLKIYMNLWNWRCSIFMIHTVYIKYLYDWILNSQMLLVYQMPFILSKKGKRENIILRFRRCSGIRMNSCDKLSFSQTNIRKTKMSYALPLRRMRWKIFDSLFFSLNKSERNTILQGFILYTSSSLYIVSLLIRDIRNVLMLCLLNIPFSACTIKEKNQKPKPYPLGSSL